MEYADNIPHEIEILSQNNVTNKNYKIKDTFSFKFEKMVSINFNLLNIIGCKELLMLQKY